MPYEIYYTSAPPGFRPGDGGFCTVASTPGMPRQLLERLEGLSGYHHRFDTASRAGRNPICHAHWILQLDGRPWHVLSRICDAGLDYSRRTNSFAHHLVLEASELASAGPAWMLQQSGVMQERWDGQVASIARHSPLPKGDFSPASATHWQMLTGDAGWAGVVAEAISDTSWKQVGLLFGENHDVLPLVSEVIALLSPAVRWQATFNTYFTNLPAGMTCQWRCSMADTPAALATKRSAASGIIIDLTQAARLEPPPPSAWVEAARNGKIMQSSRQGRGGSAAPAKPIKPAAAAAVSVPVEPVPLQPLDELAAQAKAARLAGKGGISEKLPRKSSAPKISWVEQRRKERRRRLFAVYALALVAIGAGVWLQRWAYHSSGARSLPPPSTEPVVVAPPVEQPEDVPKPPVQPDVPPVEPVVVVPPTVVDVPPVEVKPLVPASRPAPEAIVLNTPLPAPHAGGGFRDMMCTLAVPGEKFDDLKAIAALSLNFPGGAQEWPIKIPELGGSIVATADDTEKGKPGFELSWRDEGASTGPVRIVSARLDKSTTQLEFTWSTSLALRQPQIAALGYWVLQNSALIVSDRAGQRPQRIEFATLELKPSLLSNPGVDANWPSDLPGSAQISLLHSEPAGWQGVAVAAVENHSAGKKPSDPPAQVLRIEKPPGRAGVVPGFVLKFSSVDHSLTSDIKKMIESAQAALKISESELQRIGDETKEIQQSFRPGISAIQQQITDWTERHKRSLEAPQPNDPTPEQYQQDMAALNRTLLDRQTALDQNMAPVLVRQKECEDRCQAQREAIAAYEELKELELAVELPQGLRIATMRLTRE